MALYITITGQKHYFGMLPFSIDTVLSLQPEPENLHDPKAIAVYSPVYGKAGYVARTVETMADGTISAGTLLSILDSPEKAVIRFIAGDYIIAEIL
ncbi:MAG: DNA-binding protein [Ruminococcaceae bacterium]|nr:DNA-binding protein [Oscillospiraceae bacterium]